MQFTLTTTAATIAILLAAAAVPTAAANDKQTPTTEAEKSHKLLNASAVRTSDSEQWRFGLHGKNAGDEDVKTPAYCSETAADCPSTLGPQDNTAVFYGPPKAVTTNREYQF